MSFKFRIWLLRLLCTVAIWLIISTISIYVAWKNAADNTDFRWEQYVTRTTLQTFVDLMEEYRKKSGVPAKSLADLGKDHPAGDDFSDWLTHADDGWGNPMVAITNGEKLVIISYGRDGKPGGIGLDYDLTTENMNPREARPTFHQFLEEKPAKGMILSCVGCGGMAGMLAFFTIKIREFNKVRILRIAIAIVILVLISIFMAAIIAGLHIPAHEH